MKRMCAILGAALCAFAAAAQDDPKPMTAAEALATAKVEIPKTMAEHQTILRRLGALVVDRKYAELEAIANEFRESKERWGYGRWKLESFYEGCEFGRYQVKYHLQPVPYLDRMNGWIEAYPESATAHIATARIRKKLAWQNRGGGWAYEVTDEGWAGMKRHLDKAWSLLEEAEKLDPSDPELYAEWIRIANGLGKSNSEVEEIYQKGLAVEQGYPSLYMARAWYLLPRWHGNRGDVEAFAEQAVKDAASVPGTGPYAWIAHATFYNVGVQTFMHRFDWSPELLNEGFEDILSVYPNWPWIHNLRARYACLVRDKETAKTAFAVIGREFDESVWPDKFAYARWKRWAENDAEWPGGNKLHYAVVWDDVNLCRAYISAGEDIEGTDESGLTPFHLAAKIGKIDTAKFFIDQGVDIMDGKGTLTPPIISAARSGQVEMVQLLIDRGADPNAKTKLHGNSPLYTAAANQRRPMVKMLLKQPGIEVNVQDKKGATPVYIAAARGYAGIVQDLIDAGADVNIKANTGESALYWARKNKRAAAIKVLEANGATL